MEEAIPKCGPIFTMVYFRGDGISTKIQIPNTRNFIDNLAKTTKNTHSWIKGSILKF